MDSFEWRDERSVALGVLLLFAMARRVFGVVGWLAMKVVIHGFVIHGPAVDHRFAGFHRDLVLDLAVGTEGNLDSVGPVFGGITARRRKLGRNQP